MDITSHIVRFRQSRRKKNRSNPLGTIGLLLAALISIVLAVGTIYAVSRYSEITEDLPSPELMEVLLNPQNGSLLEPTRIFDQTGDHELYKFENPAVDFRRYLTITDGQILFFQDVPEVMIQATMAAADPSFFTKPEGFIAGILDNQPDPITRTLVEEFLLWGESNNPDHEIRVNLLSDQLVAEYGREKILEWYLNSLYYGHDIYGAAQASTYYFGKDIKDLDLAESTLLAAVGTYPALNPFDAANAAKENQELLLKKMVEEDLISPQIADRTVDRQLLFAAPFDGSATSKPAYVDYIVAEASLIIPEERLLRGGYQIISTLDMDLQFTLECTADLMLKRVYGQQAPVSDDCEAGRLLPQYSGAILGDQDDLEIDLVLLDPISGELRALSGVTNSGSKPGIATPRNPGTLITPFIYLNQFTQGFEPASLVWDIPVNDGISVENLHPGCEPECDYFGPINMRSALVNDYLSPAIQFWADQKQNIFQSTLTVFGFSFGSEICLECKIFPESPLLDLVDLVQGFSIFGNQGYLRGRAVEASRLEIQPSAVQRIETLSGDIVEDEAVFIEKQIISEELAYLITDVLRDHDARKNSSLREVFQIGRPAAVKLGFVPDGSSAWTIGYTPQMSTAVWVGNLAVEESNADYPQIAASLWRAITQSINRDLPVEDWDLPSNLITLDVCYPSGQLPTENCPRIVREIFIQGNEPQGADTLYQSLEINRETGLLASVFTPSEQIEEQVYLSIPAEARTWAEIAGIETSPILYDLEIPADGMNGLSLITPDNFSFVNGRVRIIGSIPEEEFDSARLQFGMSINPRAWIQIGSEITEPADSSRLGTWDTTELEDGIYAIQLVVIKESQQIEKVSLVVSVDNSPPVMDLITDLSGGEVLFLEGQDLLFEVGFENNSEIDRVEFYLNGDLISTRKVDPYLVPWPLAVGDYELLIIAHDQAGNSVEYSDSFEVIPE